MRSRGLFFCVPISIFLSCPMITFLLVLPFRSSVPMCGLPSVLFRMLLRSRLSSPSTKCSYSRLPRATST